MVSRDQILPSVNTPRPQWCPGEQNTSPGDGNQNPATPGVLVGKAPVGPARTAAPRGCLCTQCVLTHQLLLLLRVVLKSRLWRIPAGNRANPYPLQTPTHAKPYPCKNLNPCNPRSVQALVPAAEARERCPPSLLAKAWLCPASQAKAGEELTVPRGGPAASPSPAQELPLAGFWG